jgi:AraC-like DNA-binding protein
MIFRMHIPPRPLGDFVAMFWYVRDYIAPTGRERLLPTATTELVINLADASAGGAVVAGPRSKSFVIERRRTDELLGIHFHPGGFFPFMRGPLDELHGHNISLRDLCDQQAPNELVDRLHATDSVLRKFEILERWLVGIARRPLGLHPAVAFAVREFQADPGLFSCAAMAERVGFSHRHFIQTFREAVGLTPKLFCRVRRFQSVIKGLEERRIIDWADLALASGYSDQSHFNHDFRKFSGLSPTEYISLRTSRLNHIQEL